jgi:hypothetical protein
MVGVLEIWSHIKVCSFFWYKKDVTLVEIHPQLVNAQRAYVVCKWVWVFCRALGNGRTVVDNKQQPGHPSISAK